MNCTGTHKMSWHFFRLLSNNSYQKMRNVFCICCLRHCFALSAELWGEGGKGLEVGTKSFSRTSVLCPCEDSGEGEKGGSPSPPGAGSVLGEDSIKHGLAIVRGVQAGGRLLLLWGTQDPDVSCPQVPHSRVSLLCSDDTNGPSLPPGSVCPWQVWKGNVLLL